LLEGLGVDAADLSHEEAAARREQAGPNRLPEVRGPSLRVIRRPARSLLRAPALGRRGAGHDWQWGQRRPEEGRAAFDNIKRFLTYHLTDNVAELAPFALWALTAGRVLLALSVLQILALDIGTDLLPALALGAERPEPG
jgi:hypothetical protein